MTSVARHVLASTLAGAFCLSLLALAGCHEKNRTAPPPTLEAYKQLPHLMILPVAKPQRGVIPTEDMDKFSSVLRSEFEQSYRFQMLSPEIAAGLKTPTQSWSEEPQSWAAVWSAARDAGADYVLVVTLRRFQERKGDAYAAARPASVSFETRLFDTRGGQQIWNGVFDETQTSLSENVMTVKKVVKRRARWLTAAELTRDGLSDVLAALPPLG